VPLSSLAAWFFWAKAACPVWDKNPVTLAAFYNFSEIASGNYLEG